MLISFHINKIIHVTDKDCFHKFIMHV